MTFDDLFFLLTVTLAAIGNQERSKRFLESLFWDNENKKDVGESAACDTPRMQIVSSATKNNKLPFAVCTATEIHSFNKTGCTMIPERNTKSIDSCSKNQNRSSQYHPNPYMTTWTPQRVMYGWGHIRCPKQNIKAKMQVHLWGELHQKKGGLYKNVALAVLDNKSKKGGIWGRNTFPSSIASFCIFFLILPSFELLPPHPCALFRQPNRGGGARSPPRRRAGGYTFSKTEEKLASPPSSSHVWHHPRQTYSYLSWPAMGESPSVLPVTSAASSSSGFRDIEPYTWKENDTTWRPHNVTIKIMAKGLILKWTISKYHATQNKNGYIGKWYIFRAGGGGILLRWTDTCCKMSSCVFLRQFSLTKSTF